MKESLCWGCNKCTGFCSWSQDFTPVKGWDAIPTKIQTEEPGVYIDSYFIKKCPEFEPDNLGSKRITFNEASQLLDLTIRQMREFDDATLIKKALEKNYVLKINYTKSGKRQFMIEKSE